MTLSVVDVTFSFEDVGSDPQAGYITVAPTQTIVNSAGQAVVSESPLQIPLTSGAASQSLIAMDNAATSPAAGFWAYVFTVNLAGSPAYSKTKIVDFGNGATQAFTSLPDAVAATAYIADPSSGGPFVPLTGATMAGRLAPRVTALTGAATVAVDSSLGNVFDLTLTSAASGWTIGNPTNPVDADVVTFRLAQDGTGSRVLAGWGSAYDWGSGNSAPVLSTTAAAVDELACRYNASLSKWCSLGAGFPQGY